ncbi:zinc finger CCHC-type containing 10 [Aspergillus novofumigatus IBT 16806]|uniref:Zinc knuckle-domain-containing protein n=1 Tax=Aspergillus novofumigatus (strain IBT 16806) TaxID=1392255 RepID=A0A2I1C9W2_ASPN1|nr:uncharacterized protein P174DRAFT_406991 [Aspergillus novofumigatus IBT 16806]PKX94429.1 hypothetical protein P174DRAFT_406991 [Aspergillus novofumigatus IBT 16806]
MNRYRNAPGIRGPTKATASTLCQKCLKRGHYSYECTVSAQERPYTTRPSRTQQLQNPNLRPKLTTNVPNELLGSRGVADEILARRGEERVRKRELGDSDPFDDSHHAPKRSRSESSHSMSSVSTISTSRSHSVSPPRHEVYTESRGRDRAQSMSSPQPHSRKRRYSDSLSDHSDSSYSSGGRQRSRSREWETDRNTRRRRRESSPEERGRPRNISEDGSRRGRTRSLSMDQSQIAKERRSATPDTVKGRHHPTRESRGNMSRSRHLDRQRNHAFSGPMSGSARKERSLSPYSKRLALTQAMNMER